MAYLGVVCPILKPLPFLLSLVTKEIGVRNSCDLACVPERSLVDSHGGFLSLCTSHCSCSPGLLFMLSQAQFWLYYLLTGQCLSPSFLTSSQGLRLQRLAYALCPSDKRSNPPAQSLVASSLQTSKIACCSLCWLSICCLPCWEEAAGPWLSLG